MIFKIIMLPLKTFDDRKHRWNQSNLFNATDQISFSTTWKHKTTDFLTFYGVIERDQRYEMV